MHFLVYDMTIDADNSYTYYDIICQWYYNKR